MELQESEDRAQENERLYQEAGDTIEELKGVNEGLQQQVNLYEVTLVANKASDTNDVQQITKQKDLQIEQLNQIIEAMKETDENQKAEIKEKRG